MKLSKFGMKVELWRKMICVDLGKLPSWQNVPLIQSNVDTKLILDEILEV